MLMGWFIFLGAAVGVREGYHLGFDVLLLRRFPKRAQALLHTISDLAVTAFGVGMVGLRREARLRHLGRDACRRWACPAASPTCRSSSAAC